MVVSAVKKPVCRVCGKKVLYGNLHCSLKCEKAEADQKAAFIESLKANGFEQDPKTPNIYRKGGVAVTLERGRHVGLEKTLQHHAQASSH